MNKGCVSCGIRRSIVAVLGLALTSTAYAGEKFSVTWDASLVIGGSPAESRGQLRDLLSQKWHVEDEVVSFGVRNGNNKMTVGNCRALFKADAGDMQPAIYRDFKQYRSWAAGCYAVRAVVQATDAKRSFLGGFTMNKLHIRQLPVGLAFVISNDQRRKVQRISAVGGNLGDYLGNASITVAKGAPARGAVIDDRSGGLEGLRWLASGDFNDDGKQDLLISTFNRVPGGDFVSFGLYLVSREYENGPMKLLKSYPVMGLESH